MELFTRSKDPSWNRIVHILVSQGEGITESMNDTGTYKIVLLDSGSVTFESAGSKKVVSAPAMIMLTDEPVAFSGGQKVSSTTVFFKPTEIREEFTPERIHAGEFENLFGHTIYQDYLLVKSFHREDQQPNKAMALGLSTYSKLSKTIQRMNHELTLQEDGFWPCRSRSYMMELLYFISYVCDISEAKVVDGEMGNNKSTGEPPVMCKSVKDTVSNDQVSEILQYLSEHIGDKITLEDIMKEFSLNRNRLNELFVKETSMTCMNYLVKMRVNLAQIMLAETELQIAEIADRVGYPDSNYFIKVFKKHTGVTPSKYRESFW